MKALTLSVLILALSIGPSVHAVNAGADLRSAQAVMAEALSKLEPKHGNPEAHLVSLKTIHTACVFVAMAGAMAYYIACPGQSAHPTPMIPPASSLLSPEAK